MSKNENGGAKKGAMAIITAILVPILIVVMVASTVFAIIGAIVGIIINTIIEIFQKLADFFKDPWGHIAQAWAAFTNFFNSTFRLG